ncbi:hypothetical protein [uncultured Paludibaculum sp.]|uniref:hypothetical protein n=1 Tax=uncultured Paludibaculum sp. TaxID=1765020 RepID=UPI002AAB536A|nr:hypothetical protein [uncultured Paludibaculum sp.]
MTTNRQYNSGVALRTSLEERLKRISREEAVDLQRLRRQVAFGRFLARLFQEMQTVWLGGGQRISKHALIAATVVATP